MMRRALRTLAFSVLLAGPVAGQPATTSIMPVDEIRPGMKGVGYSVFRGTTVEPFGVEVLGVLKNTQPRQDMILVRMSGANLEHTSIIQGMSGSPVYIDGKLVGAIAFGYQFSKDPIAGIQPISQMLNLLGQQALPRPQGAGVWMAPDESPSAFVHRMMEAVASGVPVAQSLLGPLSNAGPAPRPGGMTRIQTPLFVSGATPLAIQQFESAFQFLGLNPVQGGGSGQAATGTSTPATLVPGSAVNVEMIRGDISISANGTVTHVDGNRVYAFGHPFLSAGPVSLPMSPGVVITVLANLSNSFKLAVPTASIGAITQDRSTGISGEVGSLPRMIPVTLNLRSPGRSENRYRFEIANDRFLTPFLMNFSVFNAITASERALGETTLNISGRIAVRNQEPVRLSSSFSGDMNGPAMASMSTVAPIQYLMSAAGDDLPIDGVEVDITSTDRKTSAQLDRISVERTEVRAGESLQVTTYLRGTNGEPIEERHTVRVPEGVSAGPIQLLVGDGTTVSAMELRRGASGAPKDLASAIRELNSLRRNDRLYIKLLNFEPGVVIGGEELPSLPPSMLTVINSDRSSNRRMTSLRNSTIAEYELGQSRYVIQGQRTLNLNVVP